MLKYKLEYSNYYKKEIYRLYHIGYNEPVKESYTYSFAFSKQEAIDNINAMRYISQNIRHMKEV